MGSQSKAGSWSCSKISDYGDNDKYLCQGSLTKGRRLSTVDLLVLTSFEHLIFILKILFTFFTKQATLIRRSTVLRLPLQ
jgi:hypothetical protein